MKATDQLEASAWEWCRAHGCLPPSLSIYSNMTPVCRLLTSWRWVTGSGAGPMAAGHPPYPYTLTWPLSVGYWPAGGECLGVVPGPRLPTTLGIRPRQADITTSFGSFFKKSSQTTVKPRWGYSSKNKFKTLHCYWETYFYDKVTQKLKKRKSIV